MGSPRIIKQIDEVNEYNLVTNYEDWLPKTVDKFKKYYFDCEAMKLDRGKTDHSNKTISDSFDIDK